MGNTLHKSTTTTTTTNHKEEVEEKEGSSPFTCEICIEPMSSKEVEEKEGSSPFTCEICIEPMSSNMKFKNDDKCVHPFCMDCMAKYIQVKVQDEATAEVECPGLNCKELLDPLSCKALIPKKVFDKWCDNLCEGAIRGLSRCYCPYKDCSALVVNDCSEGVVVKFSACPKCRNFFCFQCKIPWHEGYSCEEIAEKKDGDKNDVLFGKLVERKNWIRCPECGYMVERIAGCNDVTCRCKTRFCYRCGKRPSDHVGGLLCGNHQSARTNSTFDTSGFVLMVIIVLFLVYTIWTLLCVVFI